MNRALLVAAATLALSLNAGAYADKCNGHSHARGTVAGAAGGAVIGGLAGNAIARSHDCNYHIGRYYDHGRYYNHRRYYDARYHYW